MAGIALHDGLSFAQVPDRIALHEGRTLARLAVAHALIRACGHGSWTGLERRDIAELAGVALGAVSQAVAWLVSIGEARIVPDRRQPSDRRLYLAWCEEQQRSREARLADTHQRSGARQTTRGRAPNDKGARATSQGGARQESLPLREVEIPEDGERDAVTSPTAPGLVVAAIGDATGRDASTPPGKGGQGAAPPSAEDLAAAIAELEAARADAVARAGSVEALGRAAHRGLRLAYEAAGVELAKLRAGDASPLAPRPSPEFAPLTPAARLGPAIKCDAEGNVKRPPPSVDRDDAYPLAEAYRLCHAGPPAADLFAGHLAGRWRDAKAATVDHLRAAALALGPGLLEELIAEAERPRVRDPARYFARRAADEMAAARKRAGPGQPPSSPGPAPAVTKSVDPSEHQP